MIVLVVVQLRAVKAVVEAYDLDSAELCPADVPAVAALNRRVTARVNGIVRIPVLAVRRP